MPLPQVYLYRYRHPASSMVGCVQVSNIVNQRYMQLELNIQDELNSQEAGLDLMGEARGEGTYCLLVQTRLWLPL